MSDQNDTSSEDRKPNFFQIFISVAGAMFGVQKNAVRERDFKHGKPIHFILVGALVTLLFILSVYGVVSLVMSYAGVK